MFSLLQLKVCYTLDTRSKIHPDTNSQETVPGWMRFIMEDDKTANFTIRCETKEFRVHKAVFCAR